MVLGRHARLAFGMALLSMLVHGVKGRIPGRIVYGLIGAYSLRSIEYDLYDYPAHRQRIRICGVQVYCS